MAGIFESIKRALTGEVLHKTDLKMGGGPWGGTWTLSLRLKRRRGSETKYVVLAALAAGNYQYFPLDWDEFEQFLEAAQRIKSMAQSVSPGQAPSPAQPT